MTVSGIGIILALFALIFWGVGDFLIQKSVRKAGDWESLFVISLFGVIVLFPFVFRDISLIFDTPSFLLLCFASLIFLIASLVEFESYKIGKISIVEPMQVIEVPISGFLAYLFLREGLSLWPVILIIFIIIGLVSLSIRSHHLRRGSWTEKGVALAVLASLFMGSSNFLIASASRATNPLVAVWFFSLFLTIAPFVYLLYTHRLPKLIKDFSQQKMSLLSASLSDNLAWICFAFAASMIPVAIAVVFSESYIALAVILGVVINIETLAKHQVAGICMVIPAGVLLALMV